MPSAASFAACFFSRDTSLSYRADACSSVFALACACRASVFQGISLNLRLAPAHSASCTLSSSMTWQTRFLPPRG